MRRDKGKGGKGERRLKGMCEVCHSIVHVTLHFVAPLCRATRKVRLVCQNERAGLASDTAPP